MKTLTTFLFLSASFLFCEAQDTTKVIDPYEMGMQLFRESKFVSAPQYFYKAIDNKSHVTDALFYI